MKKLRIAMLVLLVAATAGALDQDQRLADVRRSIEENGYAWSAGPTSVSEIPWEEFRQRLGLRPPPVVAEPPPDPEARAMSFPSRFDWREMGGVTGVRNQANCGSCWAFTLTAGLESMVLIRSGRSTDLSEQQLVDCNDDGYGCDGGWFDGWTPYRDYGAVAEACYPYEANDGDCRQASCAPMEQMDGVRSISSDVATIKSSIQTHGPVVSAFTVYDDFQYYQGGCYEHAGNETVNHGVLIVGWDDGLCGGQGAWIVKNSWGTGWGEGGFAYVKYGTCRIGYGARVVDYTATASTPTPPVGDWEVEVSTNQTLYTPGDWFLLELMVNAPGGHSNQDLYVVLDVYDEYYFWPSWGPGVDYASSWWLATGENRWEILSFTWPGGAGAAADLRFHAASLDAGTSIVRGYGFCTWSYGS